jgi:predicted transcriptional regulator
MNVILSIKPRYANAILSGEKRVEFRKMPFKKEIEKVYIYSSAPEQRIVGFFTIEDIVSDTPQELWRRFKKVGSISEQDFFAYYADKSLGYSIRIKSVSRFKKAKNPRELIKNFVPPQSYRYCGSI